MTTTMRAQTVLMMTMLMMRMMMLMVMLLVMVAMMMITLPLSLALARICTLLCGHLFGQSCIERWLKVILITKLRSVI